MVVRVWVVRLLKELDSLMVFLSFPLHFLFYGFLVFPFHLVLIVICTEWMSIFCNKNRPFQHT